MTSGSVTFRKLYSRAHDDIIVIWWCHHVLLLYCMHPNLLASFPGLHAQLLLLALRKARGRPGRIFLRDACHWDVQSAHVWVCSLSFSLLSLNSVCPASPIATESIVASYSTWRQQQHASRNKSFQAFPPLFILQTTKIWAWRPGNKATNLPLQCVCVRETCGLDNELWLRAANSAELRLPMESGTLFLCAMPSSLINYTASVFEVWSWGRGGDFLPCKDTMSVFSTDAASLPPDCKPGGLPLCVAWGWHLDRVNA